MASKQQSAVNNRINDNSREIASGATSAQGRNVRAAPSDNGGKKDPWQENIHTARFHEDPDIPGRLNEHNRLLDEADKFVEYVRHVDNQRHHAYQRNQAELTLMNASGVTESSTYKDIQFGIGEYEEELEQRDITTFAKSTQPVNMSHFKYACIGTTTCQKQRMIPKLFIEALKEIQESQPKSQAEQDMESIG